MELLRDSYHKTMLLGTTKKHEAATYCVPLAFSVTKLVRVASLDRPRSEILAFLLLSSKILAGFMSRCKIGFSYVV